MRTVRILLVWLVFVSITNNAFSQPMNRIRYNNQDLFLNGANLAWVNFGRDIGLANTDTVSFSETMIMMHQSGGNALRWWLHTNGTVSPEFDASGYVTGPGAYTIDDLKKVLDMAWEREIAVDLCLWSFDMLRKSNDSITVWRNNLLINNIDYSNAYIDNCLIPMVEALKGHPAIVAWEIFNEPEGMSEEFGWSDINLVPMSSIQRFVNLCAGAIHRTDTSALVTNGSWSFYAQTDNPLAKTSPQLSKISSTEKNQIAEFFKQKYRLTATPDEIFSHLERIASAEALHYNYYRDDRLVAAGGDPDGTLDFYSVHYYSTSTPVKTSPFNYDAGTWNLNKPIVIGEFAMQSGQGNPAGIPTAAIYDTLYSLGYAGAFAWAWADERFSSNENILSGMQSVWDKYQADVDIQGTGGYWPIVSITSPQDGSIYPDSSDVTIEVSAVDTGADIDSVEIFISDTIKIAVLKSSPYTFVWTDIPNGSYKITAVAVNNIGHNRKSDIVQITVGNPPMTRLEAENAARKGSGLTVVADNGASGRKYVDIKTNDTTVTVTWTLTSVPEAGTYPITIGYKLAYESPKTQFLNINGERFGEIEFTAPTISSWNEKTVNVALLKDTNTIQIQMSWGWMYLDYLAVPKDLIPATGIETLASQLQEFSLKQNYPNPFNPATTIEFSLPKASEVKITLYNVLGQKVAALLDERLNAGRHFIIFDASKLSSGTYFYRLDAGNYSHAKKMLLIK